jgi:mitochondrial import inner membrane translocase subunit TIM23
MAGLGLGLGATYFGNLEGDAIPPIMGIEPIWIYGIATVGCFGLGYLFGPFGAYLSFMYLNLP